MEDQRIRHAPGSKARCVRASLQLRSELKKVATGRSFRGPDVVELVARLEDDCRAIRKPAS